jgi:hypothetical protein
METDERMSLVRLAFCRIGGRWAAKKALLGASAGCHLV